MAGGVQAEASVGELVEFSLLHCHSSGNSGGGLRTLGGKYVMTNSTIMGCSAPQGGGTYSWQTELALVNVLVTGCSATTDQVSEGGGGIFVHSGTFRMIGGSIRNCEASKGFAFAGAIFVKGDQAQVELFGVTVKSCTGGSYGGCMASKDKGHISLKDVSFEDCNLVNSCGGTYAINAGDTTIDATNVRVGPPSLRYAPSPGCSGNSVRLAGRSSWKDSTITDCPMTCLVISSTAVVTLRRTSVLRSDGLPNGDNYSPCIFNLGSLVLVDSLLADCKAGGIWHGPEGAGESNSTDTFEGRLALRNTTLRNCSVLPEGDHYLTLGTARAASNFQAELLTLEPSCNDGQSGELIGVKDPAFTAPLNLRGLRVIAPAACATTNLFTELSVVSNHIRLVNCSDDAFSVCDAAATCTELQLLPNVTTVNCSCQGGTFENATSPALAPYGFQPSTAGLPEAPAIDYCVRSGLLYQVGTRAAGTSLHVSLAVPRRSRSGWRSLPI